jgi:hypothetical protein
MIKLSLSHLTAKQLCECTEALSLQAVLEDHTLRIITGAIFAVEPKDTTVEMFNTIAVLLCKEWHKRYIVLQAWLNEGF